MELPSGKVLLTARVVCINDLKDKGAEKSDVATANGRKPSGQNSESFQEQYFSMFPPLVMYVSSGSCWSRLAHELQNSVHLWNRIVIF